MIAHDSRYEELAGAPVKTIRLRFEDLTDTTGDSDFDSSTTLMSATQTSLGAFLGVGTKKMEAKVLGDYSPVKDHNYDAYLAIWDEIAVDWNEIHIGQYVVSEVEYDVDAGSSVLTMQDQLFVAATTPYALNDDVFPCTVEELAEAVATTFGTTLDFDSGLPNASYVITENLWKTINNTTMKDVVRQIAEATGTTAIMTAGVLTFRQYDFGSEVMTETNLRKFKIGNHWGPLNSIVLSRMPQNDNIVLNNDTSIDAVGATANTVVNNEIVDDDRATLITPIYDFLVTSTPFINQDNIVAETEGHGWYEIGDAFTFTVGGSDYAPIITEVKLTIAGSIKETITSKIPDPNAINYGIAGGVMKSIYNTEIKVDRQANEITSIVSRQDTTDTTIADNYTQLLQDIDGITTTVQETGGTNLIENSVGYAKEVDGTIIFWDLTGTGTAVSQTSPGSLAYGGISGNEIDIAGASAKITQRVPVTIGNPYSLSFLAKKNSSGSATIKVFNTADSWQVDLNASSAYAWDSFKIEAFIPTVAYVDIEISSASADAFGITDLMLNVGELASVWSQASDEVMSENVIINREGITVKSSLYNDYTTVTPLEFAGYSDASGTMKKTFWNNRDETNVEKLKAVSGISMAPIKIVPITTGTIQGWAFVKNT